MSSHPNYILECEKNILNDRFTIRENANIPLKAMYLAIIVRNSLDYHELCRELFPISYKLHKLGFVHLNKLNDLSPYIPYCGSCNSLKIALEGLKSSSVRSLPPKHVIAFSNQLIEGACEFSGERTGAIGYSNFIQSFAYVASRDDMCRCCGGKVLKQAVEHFVWSCNYNNRHLLQSLFINIDFRLDPKSSGYEYQKSVAKLLLEIELGGDADGRPFTFPLVTYYLNDRQLKLLEEDEELHSLFWRCVAERGCFYFLAHENAGMSESDLYSFCCRLINNTARIGQVRNLVQFSMSTSTGTGSIGYFTINLPRIVFLHSRKDEWVEAIRDVVHTCVRDYLLKLWYRYQYFTRIGLYPFTCWALGERWYMLYYMTVATCGTAEAVSILLGEPRVWYREVGLDGEEYFDLVHYWYVKLLSAVRNAVESVEKELREEGHDVLINLEQSPAESSSGRFAKLDWEMYPEMRRYIPVGYDLEGREVPFYTSQITPYYTTWRLSTQLELEGKLQKYYTGGVNKIIRIHRPLSPEQVRELVLHARKLGLIYFTYSPTQSICPKCGYRTIAVAYTCPRCGTEMEIWSRIVGYYRPIKMWNPSKQAEFTKTTDPTTL